MQEDSVQLVLRLLRETFKDSGVFKAFYDGDPDMIPDFNLPCLVVEEITDNTRGGTFGEDDVTDSVVVKVIFNKKDDWTGSVANNDAGLIETTHTKLRTVVGARDKITGDYLPTTVKGSLRQKVDGDRRINDAMVTDYGVVTRPNQDSITYASAEAHITLTIDYSVDVPPMDTN